jgi:uncharacterized protein VirK/YbjX
MFDKAALEKMLFDKLALWTCSVNGYQHSLSLLMSGSFLQTFPTGSHVIHNEGELSMHYRLDDQLIYIISFTFMNESILGGSDEIVALLTRIQGVGGGFAAVHDATKSLKDVAPPFVLLAALEGFAMALGLKMLVGVSEKDASEPQNRLGAHHHFFNAVGAIQTCDFDRALASSRAGYFRLPLPIPEKPITDVKRSHRSRANGKRRLKKEISGAVYNTTLTQRADTHPHPLIPV